MVKPFLKMNTLHTQNVLLALYKVKSHLQSRPKLLSLVSAEHFSILGCLHLIYLVYVKSKKRETMKKFKDLSDFAKQPMMLNSTVCTLSSPNTANLPPPFRKKNPSIVSLTFILELELKNIRVNV